jgi:hypothetical protein
MDKIMLMGDVHMDFGAMNSVINKKHPSIVIQLGDFGYWPNATQEEIHGRSNPNYPKDLPRPRVPLGCVLHWIDGNHEQHHDLAERKSNEVYPRCFYQPRGTHMELPDGRRVLFLGGAASFDRQFRTPGFDWFPEETMTEKDYEAIDFSLKYDIVVSHTCPASFAPRETLLRHRGSDITDPSEEWLDMVLKRVKPELWFFGHWHRHKSGYCGGTRWIALDHTAGRDLWWMWLPAK